MAYKARRTRDLQGQVVAGSGISVTQSVKPDGTKVYTLENTAPGGGNEFEEVKIIDSDNNLKMLLDIDGVHIYNEDGNEVATLTKEEIILRDDENGYDKVYLSRNGQIYCNNSDGNETLYIDYDNGNISIRNNLGNDKLIIEEYENLTVLRLFDTDGNEVLNGISLIDAQNSLWSFAQSVKSKGFQESLLLDETTLITFVTPNEVREDGYYNIEDPEYTNIMGDTSQYGILVRYAGVYEVDILSYQSNNTTKGTFLQRIDIVQNHTVLKYVENRLSVNGEDRTLSHYNGGTVHTKHYITIDNDNTYIVPFWYNQEGASIEENNSVSNGECTTITIQKVR